MTLAFVYGTRGHYLRPFGLPDLPLRITSEAPPETTVAWLSYREEWLTAFPILVVMAVGGFLLASQRDERQRGGNSLLPVAVGAAVLAAALGAYAFVEKRAGRRCGPDGGGGHGAGGAGALYSDDLAEGSASVTLEAQERSPRISPLPPHDKVDLVARIDHSRAATKVIVNRPMVNNPVGRHGTRVGRGSAPLAPRRQWHRQPGTAALRSEVAVFAIGKPMSEGKTVASGVLRPPHEHDRRRGPAWSPGAERGRRGHTHRRPPAGTARGVAGLRGRRAARAEAGPQRLRCGVLVGLLVLALPAVRREETPVS